jgi:hypothetical protein
MNSHPQNLSLPQFAFKSELAHFQLTAILAPRIDLCRRCLPTCLTAQRRWGQLEGTVVVVPTSLNPLDHPACFLLPEHQVDSHWVEHVPFAMWIISALQPRVFVELGTFRGMSYCGFCQAIKSLNLPTVAFAVDTWRGDPHNGLNGFDVLDELRTYHDLRYQDFSTLLQTSFDEAASRFRDGEIDLLHIDGYHTYDAVRHDFDTWRSKLSGRGIILFHDICEHIQDFGVWQLWEEVRAQYPHFSFNHEHGLGVLSIGRDLPKDIRALLNLTPEDGDRVRSFFHQAGHRIRLEMDLTVVAAQLKFSQEEQSWLTDRVQTLHTELEDVRSLVLLLEESNEPTTM